MGENDARRRVTLREFAISSVLSALTGMLFTWWFAIGRFPFGTLRMLAFGAVGGFMIGLPFLFVEQLFGRLISSLQPRFQGPARAIAYLGAALVGFGIAFPVAGLVVFQRLIPFPAQFPLAITAAGAAIIGLAIYSWLIMKERLEASLERIKEQEFAERELEIARSIQKRLLPPPEVEGDGYHVSARNVPATYVAGDFYDVFRLGDGSLGLAVADVSGKGVGASLIMSTAKAMLPLLAADRTPEESLRALNELLRRDLGKREFVALAFVGYDPASGRARIANAGLPDPVLVTASGIHDIEVPGPRVPLGMMKNVAYESIETTLAPGDRLLIFSDGLPEAPVGDDTQLGYEELRSILAHPMDAATGEWLDSLIDRIRARTPRGFDDDCTALVLERRS